MRSINLLPADTYVVINKGILNEIDKKNLLTLYEPIIGAIATSLYLSLWQDLEKKDFISIEHTHHHLMSILKLSLDSIHSARDALEGMGLLKTYLKEDNINKYVYELYAPLSANEFFNHPIFNVVLYNNLGKKEYDLLKSDYEKIHFNLTEYKDISKPLDMTFESINPSIEPKSIKDRATNGVQLEKSLDFDLIISSIPKGIISTKAFNKKTKDLLNQLAFLYNLDSIKMVEIIRLALNEKGYIDKEQLRLSARKTYQYNNNGALPTLIYRKQPEYLKSPEGDISKRGRIIHVFENTSPYDFLKSKYKGSRPTSRDLKLLEYLVIDLDLKPAVVNVLIDYVLKRNNNKLNQAFIETIAGQWKRLNIQTADEAMQVAEKEHQKYTKKAQKTNLTKITLQQPVWFNQTVEKEQISVQEQQELDDLLKEFKEGVVNDRV